MSTLEKTEFILICVIAVIFCFFTFYLLIKSKKAKRAYERKIKVLEKEIRFDYLTGVLSRKAFIAEMQEELAATGVGSLLIFDVNGFKSVNDTFGHDVGDIILIAFSRLFERVTKNHGYIVRYGGDEFLIVMPEHTINDGIELAKSIYKAIDKSEHFIPEIQAAVGEKISIPENHCVSCSIGIAYEDTYNEERMNIALKHADMKLYAVKKNQKSNYSVWEN